MAELPLGYNFSLEEEVNGGILDENISIGIKISLSLFSKYNPDNALNSDCLKF